MTAQYAGRSVPAILQKILDPPWQADSDDDTPQKHGAVPQHKQRPAALRPGHFMPCPALGGKDTRPPPTFAASPSGSPVSVYVIHTLILLLMMAVPLLARRVAVTPRGAAPRPVRPGSA